MSPAKAAVGAPECKPALEWLHRMHSSRRLQPAIGLKPLLQVRRARAEYAGALAGGSRKVWCLNLTSAVGPVRATTPRSCSARNKVCKVYANNFPAAARERARIFNKSAPDLQQRLQSKSSRDPSSCPACGCAAPSSSPSSSSSLRSARSCHKLKHHR